MKSLILLILLVSLDQISKLKIVEIFREGDTFPVIGNLLNLTYVRNHGIAFGMFQGHIREISLVAIVAILVIAYIMIKRLKPEEVISKYAYTFILAGAIGNMIDRIQRGFVVDFIDFRGIWQFVFNLADVWINIGVILIILETILVERRKKKKED